MFKGKKSHVKYVLFERVKWRFNFLASNYYDIKQIYRCHQFDRCFSSITVKTTTMKFEIRCIYIFTLLLVVIAHVLTANDALSHKNRRQKRAFVEDLNCKQDILKNGLSLIDWGIKKITNRTANPQEGFFESLRLVFNEMQRNKSAAKSMIEEGLEHSFQKVHKSLVEKINVSKSLESALIWLYTKDNTSSAFYKSVNAALSNHNCTFTEPTK